ncbi:hypothetical protein COLO4_16518 [Corchorus olitorius]|uniref:EF-hand domain-containing protein n=1 Tax=Corchorus olitorius TaxID=93759 RepID=A0A1R3JH11_9ROSI|nr:hypothetical protein COLO4_16518 [Corchorus olitorius]
MGKDLSDDQVSSMKEAFTLFDIDGEGKIAPSELGILMRHSQRVDEFHRANQLANSTDERDRAFCSGAGEVTAEERWSSAKIWVW